MRIKVRLLSKRVPFELTVNYSYQLTSIIYGVLASSSQDYSKFLHDVGYRLGHKHFKLFTFSQLLIPKRRNEGERLISLSEHLELLISSPIDEFVQHLAQGLLSRGCIKIVNHELAIEQIEALAKPIFGEEMHFTCLSPIVVSTGAKRDEKLLAKYLRHDDPNFSEAIAKNLVHKYKLMHGREPYSAGLILEFDSEYIAKKKEGIYRLIDYKGTKIKAILAPFKVYGSPELIEMGYEAGFGELEIFVHRVAKKRPLCIVLFGSLATGEFTQHSDIDVLVIFQRRVEWMKVYECSAGRVQPLVCAIEEALREIEVGNTLLIEALEDGIPLFDRAGTYERLRRAAARTKSLLGLVRMEGGWRKVS